MIIRAKRKELFQGKPLTQKQQHNTDINLKLKVNLLAHHVVESSAHIEDTIHRQQCTMET